MKLSKLILEEYQANEEKIFKTRDLFENEKQELVLKKLRFEYIKLLDEMPVLAQAHKDAIYMEEQIEKAKPVDVDGIDLDGLKKEWDEVRGKSYVIVNNPCSRCGEELSRNNEMMLLSNPPQYQYNCLQCGKTEYKLY